MKWTSVDSWTTDVIFVYCIEVLRYNNDKWHLFSNMMKCTPKKQKEIKYHVHSCLPNDISLIVISLLEVTGQDARKRACMLFWK